jgi:hypothetical protein
LSKCLIFISTTIGGIGIINLYLVALKYLTMIYLNI